MITSVLIVMNVQFISSVVTVTLWRFASDESKHLTGAKFVCYNIRLKATLCERSLNMDLAATLKRSINESICNEFIFK